MKWFADQIKEKRKLKGISQRKLGEMLGIYQNNITKYESGMYVPQIGMAVKIAKILDIDLNEAPLEKDVTRRRSKAPPTKDERLDQILKSMKENSIGPLPRGS